MHRPVVDSLYSFKVRGLSLVAAGDAASILSMANDKWEQSRLVDLLYCSPALSFLLLSAAPTHGHHDTLKRALAAAVRLVGEELLCIWLDQIAQEAGPEAGTFHELNRHARRTAALASALARVSTQADPEHAWCAGLWHNLGQALFAARHPGYPGPAVNGREARLANGEAQRYGEDHGALLARQLKGVLNQALLSESIELHHAPSSFVAAMPGLPKVLHAAVGLLAARNDSVQHAEQLLGISPEQVGALVQAVDDEMPLEADTDWSRCDAPTRRLEPPVIRSLLLSGFSDSPPEKFGVRFFAASRLLERHVLLVLKLAGDNFLVDERFDVAANIHLPTLDAFSVCHRAVEEQRPQSSKQRTQSAADWLLAKQLGVSEFDCLPWQTDDESGVVIVEPPIGPLTEHSRDDDALGRNALASQFANAAMRVLTRQHAQRALLERAVAQARASEVAAARRAAHEISNPLTAIGNYLAIVESEVAMTAAGQKMLRQLQMEISRTQRLLAGLGRADAAANEPNVCNPNEVLLEISTLYHDSLRTQNNIALNLKLADAAPLVSISADALKQILINLVLNAAEAIGSDGIIRLRSSTDINFNSLPWLEIRVEDNGPGFARTTPAFELPMSSTKGGAHMGAGLAVCRSLVAKAQGHLICRSKPQKGTCFSVLLRLVDAERS